MSRPKGSHVMIDATVFKNNIRIKSAVKFNRLFKSKVIFGTWFNWSVFKKKKKKSSAPVNFAVTLYAYVKRFIFNLPVHRLFYDLCSGNGQFGAFCAPLRCTLSSFYRHVQGLFFHEWHCTPKIAQYHRWEFVHISQCNT